MPPPPPSKKVLSSGRHKLGVRKGFGMNDWVRLLSTCKDLAQRKGTGLRKISASEVALHNKTFDGWTILHGKVYNIAPYLLYHPGGDGILNKILGKDGTVLFEKYHRWVNIDGLIGPLLLGYLEVAPKDDDEDERTYLAPHLTSHSGVMPRSESPMVGKVEAILPLTGKENGQEEVLVYSVLDKNTQESAIIVPVPVDKVSQQGTHITDDGFNIPQSRPMITVSKKDQEEDEEAAYLSFVQSSNKYSNVSQTQDDTQLDENPLYRALGI